MQLAANFVNTYFSWQLSLQLWRTVCSLAIFHLRSIRTPENCNLTCKPLQILCKPQYHIRVAKLQICYDLPAFHTLQTQIKKLSHCCRLSLKPDNACVELVTSLRQKQTPWEKRLLRCRQSPSTWRLSYRLAWSVPVSHRIRQNCAGHDFTISRAIKRQTSWLASGPTMARILLKNAEED